MPELSKRARSFHGSPISEQMDLVRSLQAEGADIIDLTVGETGLPVPEEIKKAAEAAIEQDLTKYTTSHGTAELRSLLAKKYGTKPERVAVSNGAKTVLAAVMQCVLDPGDEAILPVPYWSCFPEIIRAAGGVPVPVPANPDNHFLLNVDTLESVVNKKTRVLILNTPCNPTGQAYPDSLITEIAEFCASRDIFLILDGCYGELDFSGSRTTPAVLSNLRLRDQVIFVGSASKAYAMSGWRLGWSLASVELTEALKRYYTNCIGCPSAISQYALQKMLESDENAPSYIQNACLERCSYVADRIRQMSNISCLEPEGGLYVWVRLEPGTDDIAFSTALLKELCLATVPGSAFGLSGYIRIACTKSLEELCEGMDRLEHWLCKKGS